MNSRVIAGLRTALSSWKSRESRGEKEILPVDQPRCQLPFLVVEAEPGVFLHIRTIGPEPVISGTDPTGSGEPCPWRAQPESRGRRSTRRGPGIPDLPGRAGLNRARENPFSGPPVVFSCMWAVWRRFPPPLRIRFTLRTRYSMGSGTCRVGHGSGSRTGGSGFAQERLCDHEDFSTSVRVLENRGIAESNRLSETRARPRAFMNRPG